MSPRGVRAAGGVLVRETGGHIEIAVVHRPRYDDWSLPKGKLLAGETDEEGALREVLEETGFRCGLGEELPSARYIDHLGRPKVVRYWRMTQGGGAFRPGDEVDELRWLPIGEAAALVSYDRDRDLILGLL